MRKCYFITDPVAGKVLIPQCWGTVHSNDINDCTCNSVETYEQFERKKYREHVKASEFRIGNLYESTDGYGFVKVDVTDLIAWEMGAVFGNPIHLTEELLVKAGFEKRDLFTFWKDKLCIRIKNPLDNFDPNGRVYWNSWTISEKQPEYVHQLQNLYHALHGEELTFEI